jgi:hypothetical protein
MIRIAVRTPCAVSSQEKAQFQRLCERGVPYPGYFAKCAEAFDFKGVGGNSCFQV